MKKVLLVLIIIIAGFFIFRFTKSLHRFPKFLDTESQERSNFNPGVAPLNREVKDLGLNLSSIGSFIELSPKNDFLVFSGTTSETNGKNKTFVANLKSGEIWQIPGVSLGAWYEDKVLISGAENSVIINNLQNKTSEAIPVGQEIFSGSISPDGNKFIFNTKKGVRLIHLDTKKLDEISKKQYDGAFAWYRDSRMVLGYEENSIDNLFEAGKGRILSIWDTLTDKSTPLTLDVPSSALRKIDWIVPENIALVNAGFDDGSFDYIVDVSNQFVKDLGETSGMMMGGVSLDKNLGLIGMAGIEFTQDMAKSKSINVVKIVNQNGDVVYRKEFNDDLERRYVQVLNDHELIYLRVDKNKKHTDIVIFDFNDVSEKVVYQSDNILYNLLVTADKKYWILPLPDTILTQPI